MSKSPLRKSDFSALSDFRYQMRRFERFSETAVQQEGITPLQYLLLLHIKGYPGRTGPPPASWPSACRAKPHGVVALVTRCEAGGLVERRRSTSDRRCVEIHLLPAGEKILTHLAELHRAELLSLAGVFTIPQLRDAHDE